MNKGLLLGPLTVIAFIILLTVMYRWVGDMPPTTGEAESELNLVRLNTPVDNRTDATAGGGHIVNNITVPAGIGNQNIQMIHNTRPFSAGIGGPQNGQMQLIAKPTFPMGIGNNQIQLINQAQPGAVYLGVDLTEVTAALANELKVPPATGVYVKSVVANSPAKDAGIKMGDVIIKCDHKPVNSREQIGRITGVKKDGDVIKILVMRDGRKKSFHVKLKTAPANLIAVAAQKTNPIWMGADIQDIDAIMKMQFNLPDKKGVIVSHVNAKSPAATAGLKTGDVIRRFNGTRLRDVTKFQSLILKGQPGEQVKLTVLRDRAHVTIPVTLGQKSPTVKPVPFLGPADIAIEGSWIGMDVSELDPKDAGTLGLPVGVAGILVNDVESPPASSLGFQTNDVITSINGIPTPDMKHFLAATKHQNQAVVDVIRGNKHLFMTVPPPGYTRQGTKLNMGINNNFKQVAANRPAGRIAIFSTGSDLNAYVADNISCNPFIILIDISKNRYAVLGQVSMNNISGLVSQYNVKSVICSGIDRNTAGRLSSQGVIIYSGILGSGMDALKLYESSRLVAMKN
uniref:MamE-like magnetosome protein n=1 Tax=Candidatus Magnetananas rongchengensis TaxID=1463558 RepID=A0A3Q8BKE7_9BACT|nr:MamE-like magnetosome protein [Candidatus Magnetananas rongchenensis]